MTTSPCLAALDQLVDKIIHPSNPVKGKIAFAVLDASMSLPTKVQQLNPSHDGAEYCQHSAEAMIRQICGDQRIVVQKDSVYARGTNDLVVYSLFTVLAHHLLESMIAVRKAVCGDKFSQQNRFLCLGGESQKCWLEKKYPSLTHTALYRDVLNTDIVHNLGN